MGGFDIECVKVNWTLKVKNGVSWTAPRYLVPPAQLFVPCTPPVQCYSTHMYITPHANLHSALVALRAS